MFYTSNFIENKCVKVIPSNIEEYLTPLALAVWFMDDGSKCGSSIKIATNSFREKDILYLCEILKHKYNIISLKINGGKNKEYYLYIYKISLPLFSKIVKPYMLPSSYYKLNGY